jgi:hypothetical protein
MRKPAAAKKTSAVAVKRSASPAAKPSVKPAAKPTPKTPVKPPVAAKPAPSKAGATALKAVKAVKQAAPKPVRKAAAPAAEPAPHSVPERERARKAKLVRDSFTMPEHEYEVLGQVKKACLKAGFEIKKSELLRIGVALISQLDLATLQNVLASLPQLKTGRPKKS